MDLLGSLIWLACLLARRSSYLCFPVTSRPRLDWIALLGLFVFFLSHPCFT